MSVRQQTYCTHTHIYPRIFIHTCISVRQQNKIDNRTKSSQKSPIHTEKRPIHTQKSPIAHIMHDCPHRIRKKKKKTSAAISHTDVAPIWCLFIQIYTHIYTRMQMHAHSHICICKCLCEERGEVGGWGRDPFSRNFMKPTPRRKWYLTTGRRFH